MAFDEERAPRYEGEDVSPTTERELKGWYFTGLAAEIFAVCGVGSFAPVTLEQLARESGVLKSDGVTPCVQPSGDSNAQRLVRLLTRASDEGSDAGACVVHPFGRETTTASFAMYTFSVAVFVQALTLVSFSPFADYGTYRKRFLMTFALTGASACMAFLLVWPQIYIAGAFLTIVGVVCLGCTFVMLNAYLPLLAASHPSVAEKSNEDEQDTSMRQPSGKSTSAELKLSTQISSKGVGLGYAAAVSVQILSIILLVLLKKLNFARESTPLRCVLLMVGIYWTSLTVPGALWLKKRPGPPLRMGGSPRMPLAARYVAFAWSSLWKTLRTALKLRNCWVYLIAWFLLSDAVATVSGTAIMFARTELQMGTIAVALLSITSTMSGIAGAFLWPKLSRRYNWPTRNTIIACMLGMEIIPIYGLIGFLPPIKALGWGGLQQSWEIYPLGVVHGFVMGGISTYCRAFYGELIPPGSEAAFYALFAMVDKGSSAVGPAIVGAIVDRIGTIRPAFVFLLILIALPIPLVYLVDVGKGRADAVSLSKLLGNSSLYNVRMEDYEDRSERESEAAEGLLHNGGGR
ncbi:MFS general substrate transporter [Hortaea werneckii]|nr:MFS general substrate transporter [Hortaea werneckii]KAI7320406.1 MFS general substrate transporter [Hortaea werneckii]